MTGTLIKGGLVKHGLFLVLLGLVWVNSHQAAVEVGSSIVSPPQQR
jgi:hypothetical protein